AHRYGRRSSVKTWIFRIAHNQAVSWIRKQSKAELLVESTIDPPSDPEKTFELNWRAEEVRSAMSQLNPIHRATVELAFVHDLSYSEISEVLDCPVGTVKSRMSSAVKQMYGILRGSEGLISR
ncbi:MAG: RNA polymerase sigma factor, partial [Candidatus Promineifilaceae bacterium]